MNKVRLLRNLINSGAPASQLSIALDAVVAEYEGGWIGEDLAPHVPAMLHLVRRVADGFKFLQEEAKTLVAKIEGLSS